MLSFHAQVDDSNEIKKLYDYAIDAIASVIKLVESSSTLDRVIDELFKLNLPIELETLSKLPTITSLKVSLVNLIHSNELPSLTDLYYTYRFLFFSTSSNFRFYYSFTYHFPANCDFIFIKIKDKRLLQESVMLKINFVLQTDQLCCLPTLYLPSANSVSSSTEDTSSPSTAIISVCPAIAPIF